MAKSTLTDADKGAFIIACVLTFGLFLIEAAFFPISASIGLAVITLPVLFVLLLWITL